MTETRDEKIRVYNLMPIVDCKSRVSDVFKYFRQTYNGASEKGVLKPSKYCLISLLQGC